MTVLQRSGYVAFLDVLGFADLIARDDNLTLVSKYVEAIGASVDKVDPTATDGKLSLRYAMFSDSVIITVSDDSANALIKLVSACSRIAGRLFALEVPVRGAIAHGAYVRSETSELGSVVAGRPITEAYGWERAQDWVGISLAPSVVRKLGVSMLKSKVRPTLIAGDDVLEDWKARAQWIAHLVSWDHIPHREDLQQAPEEMVGFAVVPLAEDVLTVKDVSAGLQRLHEFAGRMRVVAPDPRSQRKCRTLETFLEQVDFQWRDMFTAAYFTRTPKVAEVLQLPLW
jgi:hypothetical protein